MVSFTRHADFLSTRPHLFRVICPLMIPMVILNAVFQKTNMLESQ